MTALWLENPQWLSPGGALLGLAALALAAAVARARRRLRRLVGDPSGVEFWRDAALIAAALATFVALLGPRIGHETVVVSTAGVDLVLLVDVSRSMDATDIAPSRLDHARRAATGILTRLERGDRAALAAFAGTGVVLTPLTPDKQALVEVVEALDTSLIRPAASNLEAGVERALTAFEAGSNRPRVLFLLSDGEATRDTSGAAATAAVRANARILAGSLGSEGGATIPDHGVELRDERGRVVTTRRRTSTLERLASASGGRVFEADAWGHFDLDAAAREARAALSGEPGAVREQRVAAPVVVPFAAAAFALLWLEAALPALPGPRSARRKRAPVGGRPAARGSRILAAGLALVLLGADGGPREEGAWEAHALISEGLAHAESERWSEADASLLGAALLASDPGLAALAYYDLGVVALARDELELARDFFFDALALQPRDLEAQFNLEWTLRALAGRSPKTRAELSLPPSADAQPSDGAEEPAPEEESELRPGADQAGRQDSDPGSDESAHADEPSGPERSAAPSPTPIPARPALEPLDDDALERWMERIEDDPGRALRTASPGPEGQSRRDGVAW